MPTITLRPKYPRDVRPSELESLATELRIALAGVEPDLQVTIEPGEDDHRVAITFVEIVDAVIGGVAGSGATLAVETIRAWLKRRSEEKADHRPRVVNILGPDGRPIREVRLDDGAEEARVTDFEKR